MEGEWDVFTYIISAVDVPEKANLCRRSGVIHLGKENALMEACKTMLNKKEETVGKQRIFKFNP